MVRLSGRGSIKLGHCDAGRATTVHRLSMFFGNCISEAWLHSICDAIRGILKCHAG